MASDFGDLLARYIESQARPVDKFGHQPRLAALTQVVGDGLSYDRDVVVAAVWLHDLGVFAGHRPEDPVALAAWDHVPYACAQGPKILSEVGFPEEKVPAVLQTLREHQPKDEPTSIEATILRDADILEQLGAIGILRAVSKVGRDTRFLRFTDAIAVLRRNVAELPGKIRLASARKLAEPRIAVLEEFLRAVDAEAPHALY